MLRFRPSLEFRPQAAPSESTAVDYDAKAIASTQQITGRRFNAGTSSTDQPISGNTQPSFKPLLDFVRGANERKRSSVTLAAFLRQMQNERKDAEAALEQQTAAAATNFAQSLVSRMPEATSSACEDGHVTLAKPTTDLDTDSHGRSSEPFSAQPGAGTPSMPEIAQLHSSLEDPPTTQIQEEQRLTREDEDPAEIPGRSNGQREEILGKLCVFATTPDQPEGCCTIETVACPSASPASAHDQEEYLPHSLQSKTVRDRKSGHLIHKDYDRLGREVDTELRRLLTRDSTYDIEVLPQPFRKRNPVLQNEDESHVVSVKRGERSWETSILRVALHFTDAATQTTADPDIQGQKISVASASCTNDVRKTSQPIEHSCPSDTETNLRVTPPKSPSLMAFTAVDSSILPKLSDLRASSGNTQSSPPMSITEPETNGKSQSTNAYPDGIPGSEYGVEEPLTLDEIAYQYPVKETLTPVMARGTGKQVNDGPDCFLSLLDLVRKK